MKHLEHLDAQRMGGIAFLVIGLIFLLLGLFSRHLFSSGLAQGSTWYIVGGIILAIVGALLTFWQAPRHHA